MNFSHHSFGSNMTIIGKKISDNAKLGAISFIQRLGSALKLHIHYQGVLRTQI